MTPFVQQMLGRRKELDENISAIQQKLLNYPDGKLICTQNGKYIKWYHSDGHIQTYIPKKKREYAEQLAAKKYWSLRMEELVREQRAKELLTNIHADQPQSTREWLASPYKHNEKYPEQLIHKTAGGIYVRSKSESLIAFFLHMNGIPFRYECELQLGEITVYPDFTIMDPKTGKIYYWEHFGMIDDPSYARSAMTKIQSYIANRIYPTIQLIMTYETKMNPLDTESIEKTIQHYFK